MSRVPKCHPSPYRPIRTFSPEKLWHWLTTDESAATDEEAAEIKKKWGTYPTPDEWREIKKQLLDSLAARGFTPPEDPAGGIVSRRRE